MSETLPPARPPDGAIGPCRTIGELALRVGHTRKLGLDEPVGSAIAMLDREPALPGISVTEVTPQGERLVFLLSRLRLQTTLAKAFARELYLQHPIRRLLGGWSGSSLLMPPEATAEETILKALSRVETEQFEPIVVQGESGDFRVVDLRTVLLSQCATLVDLTHQLSAARAAAESASRAKGFFLANLSHEIRTPMNAILGMTELLIDMANNPRQREYQSIVKQSAESLLRLLNDVLDLSKMEAGKVCLEEIEFSPRDAIIDAMRPLALKAVGKGLELACRFDPRIPDKLMGDSGRLGQILTNLVGNAIKFTERGEIVVGVGFGHEDLLMEALHLTFSVRDSGIGIPEDRQKAIFEAFTQADSSTTRRFGGTGLGLTISTQLVALMNGQLKVKSTLGKGSVFRFGASFRRAPVAKPPPLSPMLEGRRILVVDDNTSSRDIVCELLSHWMFTPIPAANSGEALPRLRHAASSGKPFDIVLLDSLMPGMDGISLSKRIAAEPECGVTAKQIILLVSPGMLDQTGLDPGPEERVYKPIRPADLLQSISRAMSIPGATSTSMKRPQVLPARRSVHVLLAEDGAVNQQVAIALLARRGHRTTVAVNGREAIAALERERFDIVLMDLQMPEMDGLEATKVIRSRDDLKHMPVVAMTANAMPGDREMCLAAGMNGYISKPVRPDELYAAVESMALPASPSATKDSPVAAEPFDRTAALELAGGSDELMRDLAAVFIEHAGRIRTDMEDAFVRRNALKVERVAHSLKGSSSVLAARPVTEAAFALEKLGRAGELDAALEAWKSLQLELDRLIPVLAEVAASAEATASEVQGAQG